MRVVVIATATVIVGGGSGAGGSGDGEFSVTCTGVLLVCGLLFLIVFCSQLVIRDSTASVYIGHQRAKVTSAQFQKSIASVQLAMNCSEARWVLLADLLQPHTPIDIKRRGIALISELACLPVRIVTIKNGHLTATTGGQACDSRAFCKRNTCQRKPTFRRGNTALCFLYMKRAR